MVFHSVFIECLSDKATPPLPEEIFNNNLPDQAQVPLS